MNSLTAFLDEIIERVLAALVERLRTNAEFAESFYAPLNSGAIIPTKVYSVSQAEEVTTLSRATLMRAVESGELAVTPIGSRQLFLGSDLLAYFAKKRMVTSPRGAQRIPVQRTLSGTLTQ